MEIARMFTGVMNIDDSVETLPAGDWSDALNIVLGKPSSDAEGYGVVENIGGTSAVNISSIGTSGKCVGQIPSQKDDIVYLCFYDAVNGHSIVKVNMATKAVTHVVTTTHLNFQDPSSTNAYRVSGFVVTGKDGADLIYLTDGNSEPKTIHSTRYSGVSGPVNEEEIFMYKRPPLFAPKISQLITGSPTPLSSAKWVFATQYTYWDGQVSVLSPHTGLIAKPYDNTNSLSAIRFNVDHSDETVPRLVKECRLYAKKGYDGVFREVAMVYKTSIGGSWNVESQPVSGPRPGGGGVTSLFPDFNGFLNGNELESHYLQQFELLPQKVGCMGFGGGRAWIGNYEEGYDYYDPSNVTLTSVALSSFGGLQESYCFSPYSKYKYGFLLRDKNGRVSNVITRDDFVIDVPNDNVDDPVSPATGYADWTYSIQLASLPSWCHSVHLVMTRDLIKSKFWSIPLKSATTTPAASADTVFCNLDSTGAEVNQSIIGYANQKYLRFTIDDSAIGSYTFTDGDRILLVNVLSGNSETVSLPINRVVGNKIYVSISAAQWNTYSPPFKKNAFIYTPTEVDSSDIFYEVGTQGSQGAYESHHALNSAGTATFTAKKVDGDAKNVKRVTAQTSETHYTPQMNTVAIGGDDWMGFRGRTFVRSRFNRVTKPTFVRHGGAFIPSSPVNYLAEFSTQSEKDVSANAGNVRGLHSIVRDGMQNAAILALCDTDCYSIYIGENTLSGTDGSGFVVASPQVIGDARLHASGFGTKNPESVSRDLNNNLYFWDKLSRVPCRYSTNGIVSIAGKMSDYFYDQANLNAETDDVFSVYDPYYNYVFFLFKNAASATQKCIAYSVDREGWVGYFEISSSCLISGSGFMASVINSVGLAVPTLHFHDGSGSYNLIQGNSVKSHIVGSFNDRPDQTKEWNSVQIQASPNMVAFSGGQQYVKDQSLKLTFTNRHGQSTTLQYRPSGEPELVAEENMIYGALKFDSNSIGGILSGDPMYSNTLQVKVEFDGLDGAGPSRVYKYLRFVKMGADISRGHTL
jgi:hypothetical protein